MLRRLLITACLLLIAGGLLVAFTPGGDDASARTASSGVVAQLHQSGGFAGVDVRLSVRGTRRATVTQRGGTARSHTIRRATLTKLRTLVDAAHLERKLAPSHGGCADCFIYAVTARGHTLQFDDVSIPARVAPLLAELRRIAGGGR